MKRRSRIYNKATERELQNEWFKLQMKWGIERKKKKADEGVKAETLTYVFETPRGRDYPDAIPSRVTPGGSTALKGANTYTGSAMKGIGTLHKSNAIPIFDDSLAVDMASMRR